MYFTIDNESDIRFADKGKNVLILGVGGIGMCQAAYLLKTLEYKVLGFDLSIYDPALTLLKNVGIEVINDVDQIPFDDIGFVVIGNSVTRNHLALPKLEAKRIPFCSFPKLLLDLILDVRFRIVVSGTHGKSTTTALIAHLLESNSLPVNYFVGAVGKNYEPKIKLQSRELAVIEGDEYDSAFYAKFSKFFYYKPSLLLVLPLDFDHRDIFPNEEAYLKNFCKLIRETPSLKTVIIHSQSLKKLEKEIPSNIEIFEYPNKNYRYEIDLQASEILVKIFETEYKVKTHLFGRHNYENILAAVLACKLTLERFGKRLINHDLMSFNPLKKRLEIIFNSDNFVLIDDFAHHPREVKSGLEAIKDRFKGYKICVFFEPRTNTSRSKLFEEEYSESFFNADMLYIKRPIVRFNDDPLNMLDATRVIKLAGKKGREIYEVNQEEIMRCLKDLDKNEKWVVCVMSNGSFDNITNLLCSIFSESKNLI